MGIKKTEFGKTKDGKIVNLYTLTNKNGLSASFTDLGGTWVSMLVPDKDGNFKDVCLGFDSVAGYEDNKPHFGAIIMRCIQVPITGIKGYGKQEHLKMKTEIWLHLC